MKHVVYVAVEFVIDDRVDIKKILYESFANCVVFVHKHFAQLLGDFYVAADALAKIFRLYRRQLLLLHCFLFFFVCKLLLLASLLSFCATLLLVFLFLFLFLFC